MTVQIEIDASAGPLPPWRKQPYPSRKITVTLREPIAFDVPETPTQLDERTPKGYGEHASYPIEIVLPLCNVCHKVQARCGHDWTVGNYTKPEWYRYE